MKRWMGRGLWVVVAGLGGGGALLACLWVALRPPLLEVPGRVTVLAGVTLVEPGRGRLANRTLELEADRIAGVRATGPGEQSPFAGRFVLPGLIDLHVHHPPPFARGERELFALLFLTHGVTAVRDVGSLGGELFEMRARITAGEIPGPRLFACGPFLDGGRGPLGTARPVRDAAAGEAAVEELARRRADCVKVYNGVGVEAFAAIRDAAARHDLPLVMHVPWDLSIDEAGASEVQHLMGVTDDWSEISQQEIATYVETSRALGIAHTPTLVVFARAAELLDPGAGHAPAAGLLPRYWREVVWNPDLDRRIRAVLPALGPAARARLAGMSGVVEHLHAAGVPIRVGTDTPNPGVVPGASLHQEIALLAAAGLGAEGALAAATRGNGLALRVPGLGTLAPGAPADLAVFRSDPTRDLSALTTLEAVVVGGTLYTREWQEAALAREHAHFEGPLHRRVSGAAARLVFGLLR